MGSIHEALQIRFTSEMTVELIDILSPIAMVCLS